MRRVGPALIAALAAAFVVILVRTAWVSDDAFITLRTVDALVDGRGLVWNPGQRVQVFTHPLWMWVLTAVHAVGRDPGATLLVPSFLASVAAFLAVLIPVHRHPGAVLAGAVALLGSRAFVDYSTSGLEGPLTHLLLALFLAGWAAERPWRIEWLAALAGLAALNRLDSGLLFLPCLTVASLGLPVRRVARAAAIALAPSLAWMAFSLIYFGFALPNTAVAKLGHGLPRADMLTQGLAYLRNSALQDPVTLSTLGLALAIAVGSRTPRALVPLAGAALQLAYVVWVGGDFMSGRLIAAPLVVGAASLAQQLPARGAVASVVLAVGLLGLASRAPHPSLTSGPDFGAGRRIWGDLVDLDGIADERGFWFHCAGWRSDRRPEGPFDCGQRDRVAKLLEAGETVIEAGGVGFLGYWASDRLTIVDGMGIADPLMARIPSPARDRALWRPGHYPRHLPEGYLQTVRTGEDHFADRRIGALYQALRTVASAPLLDPARLDTIVGFHTGRYDALIPEVVPDEPRPPSPLPPPDPKLRPGRRCQASRMWTFRRGLTYALDGTSHARGLWVTANIDADWSVELARGPEEVAELTRAATADDGGRIERTCVPVPAEVAAAGYDGIRIHATRGDRACIGGIEPVDACP